MRLIRLDLQHLQTFLNLSMGKNVFLENKMRERFGQKENTNGMRLTQHFTEFFFI